GAAVQTFLEDSLLSSTDAAAINAAIVQVGDVIGLIKNAQEAPESKVGKGDNTDCTLPDTCPPTTASCRPNLCSCGVECLDHACTLSAGCPGSSCATLVTSASPGLGTLMFPLSGRSIFGACSLSQHQGKGFGAAAGNQYVIGGPSRTLDPVNI